MLDKLWARWKEIRANEPVKARLIQVLFYAGIVVLPFLTVWVWMGFAKAMSIVLALFITGAGLLVLFAVANLMFGWVAHYVLHGKMNWFDFDNTILDEWEIYQLSKANPGGSQRKKSQHSSNVTQTIIGGSNNVQSAGSADADGPDWLRKK